MASTELILTTGEHIAVEGSAEDVQTLIIAAARGSIMELAWLTETGSGQTLAINPQYVVALRTLG